MKPFKTIMKWGVLMIFMFSVSVFTGGAFAAEKIDKGKILTHNDEWKAIYESFQPGDDLIETLKTKIGDNLKIDVYFGFWCGDSKDHVPPFLKILESVDEEGKIPVNFYTVERKPTPETKYYAEELKVERVPTFIFYRDGKEIGRIVETPTNSLEEDFLEIVF